MFGLVQTGQCAVGPCLPGVEVLMTSKRHHTMRFGSTAKVLAECKLKYYRISE